MLSNLWLAYVLNGSRSLDQWLYADFSRGYVALVQRLVVEMKNHECFDLQLWACLRVYGFGLCCLERARLTFFRLHFGFIETEFLLDFGDYVDLEDSATRTVEIDEDFASWRSNWPKVGSSKSSIVQEMFCQLAFKAVSQTGLGIANSESIVEHLHSLQRP